MSDITLELIDSSSDDELFSLLGKELKCGNHGSQFEKCVEPLSKQAWLILKDKPKGILKYWVDYARRHPEGVGAAVKPGD